MFCSLLIVAFYFRGRTEELSARVDVLAAHRLLRGGGPKSLPL